MELLIESLLKLDSKELWRGSLSAIKLFVKAGASPDIAANGTNSSCLLCKVFKNAISPKGAEATIFCLLSVGAEPLCRDYDGSLLMYTIYRTLEKAEQINFHGAAAHAKTLKFLVDCWVWRPTYYHPVIFPLDLNLAWWQQYQQLRRTCRMIFSSLRGDSPLPDAPFEQPISVIQRLVETSPWSQNIVCSG